MTQPDEGHEVYADMGAMSSFPGREVSGGHFALDLPPTDLRLREQVATLLLHDPLVDSENLKISVEDGTVTLHGTVFHPQMLPLIEERISLIVGVKAVVMELEIRTPLPQKQRAHGV